MRQRSVAVIVVAGLLAAAVAAALDAGGDAAAYVLLAAGIALGELLPLRLEDGTGVPLSYPVILVLAAGFGASEFLVALVAGECLAVALRPSEREPVWRFVVLAQRVIVGSAAFVAYSVVLDAFATRGVAQMLCALGAAAVAQLGADEATRRALRHGTGLTRRGRLAWLSVGSSGMLMAIGYEGVGGRGDVGIWGPLLFAIPLLATWYAFERLDLITRTYHQTVEALAQAPEYAELVPAGHAERVARLAVATGRELSLSERHLDALETAALLHHLGQVTLDEPTVSGRPHDPVEVAAVTSAMMRDIPSLAVASRIIAGDGVDGGERLAAQALRAAGDFDELTTGRDASTGAAATLAMLTATPGYVYEPRVVEALARVIGRGAVPAIARR